MISRFHAFLRRQPRAFLVGAGMLWIALLAILDYFAPLDLSFLIFYVAPVLFLVWFVGLAAGMAGAAASAAFWIWEDLYSPHAYTSVTIADWNIAVRLVFLVAFAWVGLIGERKRDEDDVAEPRGGRTRRPRSCSKLS